MGRPAHLLAVEDDGTNEQLHLKVSRSQGTPEMTDKMIRYDNMISPQARIQKRERKVVDYDLRRRELEVSCSQAGCKQVLRQANLP